ncbi:hypothetical protein DdX_02401 [Ditylenchus destructor]|uniref:Uncharacterized protein n=1 Tax=Ditylenchus destructor TaxID=166010 RepID=A0AAD4NH95_9BILA|nr:hypothetical protein DdX_02401 [Ditylenchus destructor]
MKKQLSETGATRLRLHLLSHSLRIDGHFKAFHYSSDNSSSLSHLANLCAYLFVPCIWENSKADPNITKNVCRASKHFAWLALSSKVNLHNHLIIIILGSLELAGRNLSLLRLTVQAISAKYLGHHKGPWTAKRH